MDLERRRVMRGASRNSLPSRVFDAESENRGVQNARDLGLGRKRTERILVREKGKEVGRTSSEPRKVFR